MLAQIRFRGWHCELFKIRALRSLDKVHTAQKHGEQRDGRDCRMRASVETSDPRLVQAVLAALLAMSCFLSSF